MKYAFLLLLFFSVLLRGETLKVGYEPSISSEVLNKELAPITLYLKQYYGDVFDVTSKSANEFLKLSQKRKINFTYVGSAYASLLTKRYGFIPLLSSKGEVEVGVVANVNEDYNKLKNNADTGIYYVAHDLYGQYMAGVLKPKARLESRMSSERVIFSVLKKDSNLGIIFKDDLGLIPTYLSQKLVVHERLNVGRIYLLVGPSLVHLASELQQRMLEFHENWKDQDQQYFYLNFYKFDKWKEVHKSRMHVSDDFQKFLETVVVK